MKTQGKMEHEIDLMELFWNTLFAWRQIICIGIVTAILVCGLKYVLDNRAYYRAQNTGRGQEEIKLTAEERESLETAQTMMRRIEDYEKYLNESVLMQIDPYEKPVAELQYYVKSNYKYNYTQDNQLDYTQDLVDLYCNYIQSGEMSNKVIEAANLSISQADFSELCSVSQNEATIAITIAWAEIEKLDEISEFIETELKQKESDFQEVGSHRLKLLQKSVNVIADTELAEKKNMYANNITTINTQLNALKTGMSGQQLKLLSSETEAENKDDKIEIIKPRLSIEYAVLGAILGLILTCIWVACKMVFTAKLRNPDEVRALYDTRLLGEITVQSEKKRFLSVIDDKLFAIKNRKKKKLSVEQQMKVIVANIILSCKQRHVNCIYMTGSEYENVDVRILNMLKQELSEQGIQINEGGNIFYDAESLKKGTEIGNLIFVEQKGLSIYDEIFNELNLAREQNNHILGVVVLV